jgi:hypothetical protein
MPGQETGKGAVIDAVMAAGQPEGRQTPAAYPAQDRSVADATALGDKSDRNVGWRFTSGCFRQITSFSSSRF